MMIYMCLVIASASCLVISLIGIYLVLQQKAEIEHAEYQADWDEAQKSIEESIGL